MKKQVLFAVLFFVGVKAYNQNIKTSTYTTGFQWSNKQVEPSKLYHFQTQDYRYGAETVQALNSGENDLTDAYLLSNPINYGFNVAFAPEKLTFSKGALFFSFGMSKLVQQELFTYSNITSAENAEYESMEGKFFINRNYISAGFTWEETLFSKEKWSLQLTWDYLFHLNTNTNSHVTVRKDTQDGIEFVNSMERLDVPAVNIFSLGMNASPSYKLGEASSVSLELGFKVLNYLNKSIYDKAQLSPNIALAYHYKF